MIVAAILLAATDPAPGTWEGTSLCQVKGSPCHDEHVIYLISSMKPQQYKVDAYKLVAGQKLFMGAIYVTRNAAGGQLVGPVMSGGRSHGQLRLTLQGPHLSGTMTTESGTLYRLIEASKH